VFTFTLISKVEQLESAVHQCSTLCITSVHFCLLTSLLNKPVKVCTAVRDANQQHADASLVHAAAVLVIQHQPVSCCTAKRPAEVLSVRRQLLLWLLLQMRRWATMR
jgi:hypothetical protein